MSESRSTIRLRAATAGDQELLYSIYASTREELRQRSADLFSWVANGSLRVRIDGTFPLANAADAHRALESRATTGKLLLLT